MGYRSDVTAMFYCPERKLTYTQTMDWLRTNFPAVFEAWPAGHWAPLDDSKDVTPVVFKADYCKWYTKAEFKDVAVFEDMLEWFESVNPTTSDEECPSECEFGRIGEDTEDIEYRCSFNAQYRMQQVRAWDLT
jgi:hypothetical protein